MIIRIFVRNVIKHVIVIEDCNNGLLIATSILKVMLTKKWDVENCKIKISKNFTQSEKLRWSNFNWYLTNTTLNKHLLVGTWRLIFYKNTFKTYLVSDAIFRIWKPFKNIKNTFYFTLKALFILKIFKFFSWLFGDVEETA